jgi:hypothetical protein
VTAESFGVIQESFWVDVTLNLRLGRGNSQRPKEKERERVKERGAEMKLAGSIDQNAAQGPAAGGAQGKAAATGQEPHGSEGLQVKLPR